MAGITRHHRVVRERIAKLKKQWAAKGLPCHLCGLAISYDLPQGHPGAVEGDHVIPIAEGGHPLGELAPAHRHCNQSRGKRDIDDFRLAHNLRMDDTGKPTHIPEVKRPMKW